MSKPPTAGSEERARAKGLASYLRDRPIWVKLGLIMMVPTIATVVVGLGALLSSIGAANNADRARSLAALSLDIGALTHDIQEERAAAVILLDTPNPSADTLAALRKQYQATFDATDQSAKDYTKHRNLLVNLPGTLTAQLNSVDAGLARLADTRAKAVQGPNIDLNTASSLYIALVDGLLTIREGSAQLAGDTALSFEMRAAASLAQHKEYISLERVDALRVLLEGRLSGDLLKELLQDRLGQALANKGFEAVATPEEQEWYQQVVSGPALRQAQGFEGQLFQLNAGSNLPSNLFTVDSWDTTMAGWSNLMRQAEKRIDAEVNSDAVAQHNKVQSQMLIEAGLLLGLVLIAVLIAWFVARSMNRALRDLRHGALAIAQYGLPQAVARLRDPSLSAQMTPHQVALQIADPLPVRSNDEFGQVTEAFNAVHLEAVRTAAEQAALRSSVSTMFVNLARRSQILVDRLIGHLDRLERGEEDPDRLAELFQLDHLATRMRRNDENLLVLAGADSSRVQRDPAGLIDVLRAAQSEVEHYTRIEFGIIDRDIEIAAHAVNDLVHLVAELFDNATAFSPPDSTVTVEARRVGDRAVLYVEDHGIGVSTEQLNDLNERLATPPMVDVAVSRMMGLVVVARLAVRHGVKVELRPAPERGTIADVLLPTGVLVPRALVGREQPGMLMEPPRPARQAEPPWQSSPLALESGRGDLAGAGSFGGLPAGGGPSAGGVPPTRGGFGPINGTHTGARQLPPWSDLTGASATESGMNGSSGMFTPRGVQPEAEPLPRRPEPGDRNGTPRQAPLTPEARPLPGQQPDLWSPQLDAVDADVVEEEDSRPVEEAPVRAASAGAPPAWPPLPDYAQPADEAPPVPESLASSLDITSEMPRVRPDAAPVSSGAPAPEQQPWDAPLGSPMPSAVPGFPVTSYADQTMELPIFRELESAWFTTHAANSPLAPNRSAVRTAEPAAVPMERSAESSRAPVTTPAAPMRTSNGPSSVPTSSGERMTTPERGWRSAADAGWQAASAASDVQVTQTTNVGLPKRTPMAQLVPGGVEKGGVEKAAPNTSRRSPEQVRGLLSAYHRGVQRGRTRGDDANSREPLAPGNPPHGGKEQEA